METHNEDVPDDGLLEQLERAYLPPEVPKCRICGGALAAHSIGGGSIKYYCDNVKPEGGKFDWDHFGKSEWVDYRSGGDLRVIELVQRYKSLRSNDELSRPAAGSFKPHRDREAGSA